jgi:4-oxalocrotonate tautomerase
MPVISVEIGPIASREVKAELVQALTEAAVNVTKIPADKFTVLIKELDMDNIGISGKLLSDILK